MRIAVLLILAFLLTNYSKNVRADDYDRDTKMHKLFDQMDAVGIDNTNIKDFVDQMDSHLEDGYLSLAEKKIFDGEFTVHYQLDGKISTRQVEMKFVPDDSNMQYIATTHQIMARYVIKLP